MQRHQRILLSLITIVCLAPGIAGPVEAARPADPYISRMTAVAGWVTDPLTSDAYYVIDATVYAEKISKQNEFGYRFTFSDGTVRSEGGVLPPTPNVNGESVILVQGGQVPENATSVTFAAQIQRRGRGGFVAASPTATVTAALPERPDPPPAPSTWQVVFDVSFTAP